MSENDGTIFLACDTIINFLLNNEKVLSQVNGCDFVHLLQAMALWAGNSDDTSVVMMASSICALVFDLTYEEALLMHDGVDCSLLEQLSQLFARSLSPSIKWGSDDIKGQLDLHEIISSGFSRWVARFPSIKKTIERPSMLQC
uniref:Regulatory protein recX n=1 Tax=Anthurium amnicola TaxID=1678845 RepID=A0A1D1Z4Q7_9ARAE